ncbi:hypothetical protein JW916_02280 [Candidatus Sumerlaeota bacterium]|nr:hypothetical protein [Candidatus Sumerlaeota bacterium]
MRRKEIGTLIAVFAFALVVLLTLPVAAQQDEQTEANTTQVAAPEAPPADQPPAPPAGAERDGGRRDRRGERGDRGMRDPEQWRSRMMAQFKENLEASDDEWKVIEPLLGKVLEVQQANPAMRGFFGRGPRGPRGPEAADTESESGALRTALESKDTPPDEIKTKLDAFRAAVAKNQEDLKTAREELRKVLTVRQEASLVMRGILD